MLRVWHSKNKEKKIIDLNQTAYMSKGQDWFSTG